MYMFFKFSQQGIVSVLDNLDAELVQLNNEILNDSTNYPPMDVQRLCGDVTRAQTMIVTQRTKVGSHLAHLNRYSNEKRKQMEELERYELLVHDLQNWSSESQKFIEQQSPAFSSHVIATQIQNMQVFLKYDVIIRNSMLEEYAIGQTARQ